MPLRYLTAGESHGPALTAILEGIPAGLPLEDDSINRELTRRQQGYGASPRMKMERDTVRILSGVMDGKTTGSPLAFVIENLEHVNWRDKAIDPMTIPRPGHADLTGAIKYGYNDLRPALERASARETAVRVAVGAVCKLFLACFDIQVGGYVRSIGNIEADLTNIPFSDRLRLAEESEVRCSDVVAADAMRQQIREVMQNKDTLGGVVEVIVLGLPPGLGTYVHWDRKLEARLGAAVLGVQAIKGIEIGPAFENAHLFGTQAQDRIGLDGEIIIRLGTDRIEPRSGGLEGGITTGQPLIIRAAMKPIATTLTPQATVDLANGEETLTRYERSDFCPVPRTVPIIEAVVAIVMADALLEKLGGDSLSEIMPRFATLRQARLSDLTMDNFPHVFWPDND